MTVTRADVADLREGDVVEVTRSDWPEGTVVRGPLRALASGGLAVGATQVRYTHDEPVGFLYGDRNPWSLTVVSRAPRPLYVNHPRTEPVPGDVVRDAEVLAPAGVWLRPWDNGAWIYADGGTRHLNSELPTCLRLLVDGETGQVVPS